METSAKWFSKMAYRVWILPQVDFYRIFWPYDPRIECHGTRDSLRKSAQPTVAVIDSQSVRTGLDQSVKGIDGGKKIKGIKRHLAVDSNGFPLTIVISRANVHDSKGAIGLAIDTVCKYSTIRLLKADNGYRGPLVKTWKRDCLWNWSVWNRISAHRNSSRLAAGGLWNAPSRGLNLSDD